MSVVVVVFNIPREAPRTLRSLSADYQRHIDADDYEIIVVDNGSHPPFDPKIIKELSGNFRLVRIDDASPSPVQAVNRGIALTEGEVIGVMIDGARLVTPGLVHFAYHGSRLHEKAVVVAPGWYLGYDFQRRAMQAGYDRAAEDQLLDSIAWPNDGYRLFEIGTMDESSLDAWFLPIAEANALFMHRNLWEEMGGLDERFDLPGGGLVNLDTYTRALEIPDAQRVFLLGEATFHQLHGGIATNISFEEIHLRFPEWDDQYERLRGRRFHWVDPVKAPMYVGVLPSQVMPRFLMAAIAPVMSHYDPPLGKEFDQQLFSAQTPQLPADANLAGVINLAHEEFRAGRYDTTAALARMVRSRAPKEPEPQRLLAMSAVEKLGDSSEYYFTLGEAHRLLGENDQAKANFEKALSCNSNLPKAHLGLANLRMPGEYYLNVLERLYGSLSPQTVVEIGVFQGASLALHRPPTRVIGIDPTPTVIFPLKTETHIFAETSDAFFGRRGAEALLAGRPLSAAFIDGLHIYEQALKDFLNLEMLCGPGSVILFHDTVPLDEATQTRECNTQFHTGDVWKTIICLKHYRPDLDIFTIATPWTGLTVVTGVDPTSRVLAESYEEAVARFIDMPFAEIENRLDEALNMVPNDWAVVEERLKARGILLKHS